MMGFSVGVTTLKLANKVSSKAKGTRTGKLRGVACEALKERWGRDPDIDRTLTPTNVYQGEFDSGVALAEQLSREAQEYSEARKAAGGRGLREDAAIGYAVILKPNREAIVAMSPEERERFFRDSQEILDGIFQSKCRARVRHRDEPDENGVISEHEHSIYDGFCKDGRLCVNDLVNPKIWKQINVEYPRKMREKGWEVDDCELYDEEKAKKDPVYKAAREAKRRDRAMSAPEYKRRARKAALDAYAEDVEQTAEKVKDVARQEIEQQWAAIDAKSAEVARREKDVEAREKAAAEREARLQERERAVEADRRRIEAREAVLTGRYTQIARAATEAATEALRRAPEDKRDGVAVQANARAAAQAAIEREDVIQRAKAQAGAVKQPGQQWQRQGWQLG